MSDEYPVGEPHADLLIATFAAIEQAEQGYSSVRDAEKQGSILLVDAAIVTRDESNRLHIREDSDIGPAPGALWGAGIGLILGTIAGPLGLLVGGAAGALLGSVATGASDAGIPDGFLEDMASTLRPGTAMVAVVVDRLWLADVQEMLAAEGGEVTVRHLPQELAQALKVYNSGGPDATEES